VRILLVDDNALLRRALRQSLELVSEFDVVGEAGDGLEALGRVEDLAPDVVVMDVNMPRMGGAEATRLLRRQSPRTRVLAFSSSGHTASVATMLDAGAYGYVLKGDPPERLVAALAAAVEPEHSRRTRPLPSAIFEGPSDAAR
jgi:DNA-binding NarL/FixJ family response regulator